MPAVLVTLMFRRSPEAREFFVRVNEFGEVLHTTMVAAVPLAGVAVDVL